MILDDRGYRGVALNPQRGADLPSPVVPPPDGVQRAASPAALRRVLRRARDGVALNVDEAAIAMTARGDDLADLWPVRPGCATRVWRRRAGAGATGRLPVSYSRKVFIPVTHLCRDTCHYCTFVTVPGKLRAAGQGHVHGARRDPRRRPPRCRIGLQGSAFHPRRPAGGAVGRSPAVARRARLRLDAGLRARDGDPGARGDRSAAAPEPRA